MQSIEGFLEDNQVYEMMEDLLKQIIVARPDDPLAFLLQKIKQNPGKSKFLGVIFLPPKTITFNI